MGGWISSMARRVLIARPRHRTWATILLMVVVAGCTSRVPLPSGAIVVRTDDGLVNVTARGILCNGSSTVPPPMSGDLVGDPTDLAWPVWVQAADGRRMYVIWPRGFSVRFDPLATLLDETGQPILHQGSPVSMADFADPSSGTREQPYAGESFYTGLIRLPHCYMRD